MREYRWYRATGANVGEAVVGAVSVLLGMVAGFVVRLEHHTVSLIPVRRPALVLGAWRLVVFVAAMFTASLVLVGSVFGLMASNVVGAVVVGGCLLTAVAQRLSPAWRRRSALQRRAVKAARESVPNRSPIRLIGDLVRDPDDPRAAQDVGNFLTSVADHDGIVLVSVMPEGEFSRLNGTLNAWVVGYDDAARTLLAVVRVPEHDVVIDLRGPEPIVEGLPAAERLAAATHWTR